MVCSFALNRGVCAVILMEDGKLVAKSVSRANSKDTYENLFDIFLVGLRLVRRYVAVGGNVVFETGNSALIKWVNEGYAKEAYQDKFMDVMRVLQELPVTYKFVHNTSPLAMSYANAANIGKKVQLCSLE